MSNYEFTGRLVVVWPNLDKSEQKEKDTKLIQGANLGCKKVSRSGHGLRPWGGLCFFHANANKAAELGRIGGKKNGRLLVGIEPLPNLDNAMAVRDPIARLIDVYAGKLHPRIAAGLAPLIHLQLRVLEKTEIEKRLARVEWLVRESTGHH